MKLLFLFKKKEQLILSPLCSMNEISFSDVRAKQLGESLSFKVHF